MKKLLVAAGLACACLAASASTELVSNGNFESGTFGAWVKSGDVSVNSVTSNTVTSNHTYVWREGSDAPSFGYIGQTIATLAGASYTFSFDVYNSATTDSSFIASFGGATALEFTNEVHDWTHYSFTETATGTATLIKFGAFNTPSFVRLDNVSVTAAVPEPESYAMLMAGLGLLGLMARRRKA